mgnify:CR=1 FL=1
MLNLASDTDPAWVDRALADVDLVLVDHAHCEKKAAATALGLIFRYPEHPSLMTPLSELAREELAHFELVLTHIRRRGGEFVRIVPGPYAADLLAACRREEPGKLIDTLLCCALIEARSCERMQLLAERFEEPELAALYRGLLASEARHHSTYVDLLRGLELVDEAGLRSRLVELAQHEATVVARTCDEARFHN